jgi:hypothetical protein
MVNKFNIGDIVYSVYVSECLVVNVNQLVVDSFFFNNHPDHNKFIYSCTGIGQVVIRDYETPVVEGEDCDRNPGATISSSTSEDFMYSGDLEEVIALKVEQRRESNRRVMEEAEKFRCPITDGRMSYIKEDFFRVFDGPSRYKVEGSKIVWEKWPRTGAELYQTKIDEVEHAYIYHGDGNWEIKN